MDLLPVLQFINMAMIAPLYLFLWHFLGEIKSLREDHNVHTRAIGRIEGAIAPIKSTE